MGMDLQMVNEPDPTLHPGQTGYYRFRTPAMRAMVQVMRFAGVFDEELTEQKFQYNDGELVTPAQCTRIVEALERYGADISDDHIRRVEEVFSEAEKALIGRFAGTDLIFLKPATTDVRLGRAELESWIREWVEYNRVAAAHGGYTVN